MKAKKKLLWLAVAAALAVCAVVGAVIVSAAEPETGKDGVFNGSPAHVDENGNLYIDEINFPDEKFRDAVKGQLTRNQVDEDNDGRLSENESTKITMIVVSHSNVTSLSGIEFLTSLTDLYCTNNQITGLDVSKNTALKTLTCPINPIKKLDLSKNTALIELDCRNNLLTELDLSNNTALEELSCLNDINKYSWTNDITELDLSANKALTSLNCRYGNLTKLDVSANTSLKTLWCNDNNINELDLSENTLLESLICDNNDLSELDVTNNKALTQLHCDDNNLTELNVSQNKNLIYFSCGNNNLTELDVSANTLLVTLSFDRNNITDINVSSNTVLSELGCSYNNLSNLDLSANASLSYLWCGDNKLTELDISKTNLSWLECDYNEIKELDLSAQTNLYHLDCGNNNLTTLDLRGLEKLSYASIGGQASSVAIPTSRSDDEKYIYDLSAVIGDYADCVTDISSNNNVKLSYDAENASVTSDEFVDSITYTFAIPGSTETMTVTLTNISAPPCTLIDKVGGEYAFATYPEDEAEYYTDVELVVERNAPAANIVADKAFKGTYKKYTPYEIKLIKDGEEIQPASTLTIKLPIPAGWNAADIAVYHVKDDGTSEFVESKVEDGYIVFTVNHLSTYVLVDTSTKIEPEKTPDDTTKEPDDTTKAPDDTTKAPDDTTKEPDDTTKAPDDTTKTPDDTTKAPDTTTAPAETTAAPVETTTAPAETTAAPADTTATPADTTAAPVETTAAPVETTAAPASTTAAPSSGSTAEPPKTGGTVNAVAAIVAAMCTCAAGAVVAYGVRKRK